MLESIAKSLKYNRINWEIINTPYLPPETINNQQMGEQLVKDIASLAQSSVGWINEENIKKMNESLTLSIEKDKLDIQDAKKKNKKSSKK